MMREKNQRTTSGLGCGIAYRGLFTWRVAWRNREGVLGSWRKILAHMLRSRGIPDFAREHSVPCRIKCLDRTHTNRKPPSEEWIIVVGSRGIFFRILDAFTGHQEYLFLILVLVFLRRRRVPSTASPRSDVPAGSLLNQHHRHRTAKAGGSECEERARHGKVPPQQDSAG